jgi:hypothetical protein
MWLRTVVMEQLSASAQVTGAKSSHSRRGTAAAAADGLGQQLEQPGVAGGVLVRQATMLEAERAKADYPFALGERIAQALRIADVSPAPGTVSVSVRPSRTAFMVL